MSPESFDFTTPESAKANREDRRRFLEVGEPPAHLNSKYRRFALVSSNDVAEELADDDTLLVFSDWLQWQRAAADGIHGVHFEHAYDGTDPECLAEEHFLRACDWVYLDSADATLYRGVSLGRKLVVEVGQAILEYDRLTRSLESLIVRFNPEQIVFVDFQAEITGLSIQARSALVAEIADLTGIEFVDQSGDTTAFSDPDSSRNHALSAASDRGDKEREGTAKKLAGLAFERGFNLAGRIYRKLRPSRPAVLVYATERTSSPLIENFGSDGYFIEIPAQIFPHKKKIGRLLRSFFSGVLPVAMPENPLTRREIETITAMLKRISDHWKNQPVKGRDAIVRDFVRNRFLSSDRAFRLAANVNQIDTFLDRARPGAIFVDGMLNVMINILFELARQRGIPVAGIWHSPILQKSGIPIFGNDPRVGQLESHVFTWGGLHETWLRDIGATSRMMRTGVQFQVGISTPPRAWCDRRRALVLQLVPPGEDVAARTADEFDGFVKVVRMLGDLGYTEIRVKLHPSRAIAPYYKRIIEFFGLRCEVAMNTPFEEHLDWADFVIGPIYTAAMVETLSVGKPYFPFHIQPSSMRPDYLKGMAVCADVDVLRMAVSAAEPPDQRDVLEHLIARSDCPRPIENICTALGWLATQAPSTIDQSSIVGRQA